VVTNVTQHEQSGLLNGANGNVHVVRPPVRVTVTQRVCYQVRVRSMYRIGWSWSGAKNRLALAGSGLITGYPVTARSRVT